MDGSADMSDGPRHFIAVNHHRFHDPELVERAVTSAVIAARRLRDLRPGEGVAITLYHAPDAAARLATPGLAALRELVIEPALTPSNGTGLNAQMDAAMRAGATYFYRVDADDPVHPDRFVRQADLMDRTGADVSGGGLVYTNLATGARQEVLPRPRPAARDYLTNSAMLHPSLAFRLSSLHKAGIRYWDRRLEDKQLGLQIAQAGLRLVNDSVIYGDYSLNPEARTNLRTARLNLELNWLFIRAKGRYDLLPLALALFAASALLPSQWLRRARHALRGDARQITPCSGSAGGSDTGRTAPPPRARVQKGTHR